MNKLNTTKVTSTRAILGRRWRKLNGLNFSETK